MATQSKEKRETPSYVSYRTHLTAIEALRADGIPTVLDRTSILMSRMSGAYQSQLRSSWRFLGLMDEGDKPTPILERLVYAQEDERKQVLREILEQAYPFLLGDSADLDLSRATPRQFSEAFEEAGVSGETIRKAESFFLKAAEDAEIKISPQIVKARQPGGDRSKRNRTSGSSGKFSTGKHRSSPKVDNEKQAASLVSSGENDYLENGVRHSTMKETLKQMMVSKLPEFNPEWKDEVQAKWFDAFTRMWNRLEDEEELEE